MISDMTFTQCPFWAYIQWTNALSCLPACYLGPIMNLEKETRCTNACFCFLFLY